MIINPGLALVAFRFLYGCRLPAVKERISTHVNVCKFMRTVWLCHFRVLHATRCIRNNGAVKNRRSTSEHIHIVPSYRHEHTGYVEPVLEARISSISSLMGDCNESVGFCSCDIFITCKSIHNRHCDLVVELLMNTRETRTSYRGNAQNCDVMSGPVGQRRFIIC